MRCTKMALIHDMAEALVGDITPVDNVPKPEKCRRETDSMDYFCKQLLGNVEGGETGKHIRELWQEYEDSKTLESTFVHDVDKLELLLQMMEYERAAEGTKDLSEFTYVATQVKTPEVRAWCEELLDEQQRFWRNHNQNPVAGIRGDQVDQELKDKIDEYYDGKEGRAKEAT